MGKIKEPDLMIHKYNDVPYVSLASLTTWFHKNVKPYEFYDPKDAVEVTRAKYDLGFEQWREYWTECPIENSGLSSPLAKATLINIEPIVKDTHESVLRDILKHLDDPCYGHADGIRDAIERARKMLKDE